MIVMELCEGAMEGMLGVLNHSKDTRCKCPWVITALFRLPKQPVFQAADFFSDCLLLTSHQSIVSLDEGMLLSADGRSRVVVFVL